MTDKTPEPELPLNIPRLSPNCEICNSEDHVNYPHNFHTTRQHDDWWQMMQERQQQLAESEETKDLHTEKQENLRGLFDD